YIGNQLTKVTENGSSLIKSEGFKDVNNAIDYTYDVNGNMTKDLNKGITNISYNHLNLPTKIHFRNGGSIDYKYDARGVKLEKEARGEYGDPSSTQYAGNYIYKKNPGRGAQLKLAFFNHPEGYVSPKNASDISQGFKYVYQYKDHLGNVRLSYTDNNNDGVITPSTEIIEESNYYPFGLKHKGYNNVVNSLGNSTAQKFGYNGKELNEELGLEWHDFGARNYDAALGRWMNLDPLAEKMRRHSPYNYAFNNPIYWIDPDGMAPQGPGHPPGTGAGIGWAFNRIKRVAQFKQQGNSWGASIWKAVKGEVATGADFTPGVGDVKGVVEAFTGNDLVSGEKLSGFNRAIGLVGLTELRAADKAVDAVKAIDDASDVVKGGDEIPDALYHYTDDAGLEGITASKEMNPSLKANNPEDARYGDGQYFSNIKPGTKTNSQLSRKFLNIPFQGKKFSNFIKVKTEGLNVLKGRDGVYVVPNKKPLDLTNRIIETGKNQ
ncbi:HYD1 signature containing ADP-ribosyltransferase family protein, partial [Tenacibaculum maritimum]|uniref:HYD1 signature containing ADP-ribosyltransferase family protein n=1 Tax=Tenacibaculum maritimum TaxID=107401 RepID=UPI001F31904E